MALLLALACAGCASVTRGWNEQMQFQSEPLGAEMRTSLGQVCTTPCTLQISRKDEFSVVFTKPGYRTTEIDVKTRLAGSGAAGFAGNVILGGVIGMGVDAASGATLEHCPNPVFARLEPLPGPKPVRRGSLRVRPGAPPPVVEPEVQHLPNTCAAPVQAAEQPAQ